MKILILALILAVSCSSHKKVSRPFYYKVSLKEKNYFVLGTMHIGVSLKDLPVQVKTDLQKSDIVVVEYDEAARLKLNTMIRKKRQSYMWGHSKNEFPLKERLTPEAWDKLLFMMSKAEPTDFILKSGIQYPYEKIHPAFVGIMTNHFIQLRKFYLFAPGTFSVRSRYYFMTMSDELEESIDKDVLKEARFSKIPVVSLGDTSEKMIDENLDFERSALNYLEGLFGFANPAGVKLLERYHQAYRNGDEKKFLEIKDDVKKVELLGQKTSEWPGELQKLKGKNFFIAVGTFELLGENSLLDEFRKQGAEVSRVDFK
jgi:uncharacterized protein YbaP (TraB family)